MVIPKHDETAFDGFDFGAAKVHFVNSVTSDQYVDQQYTKCCADQFTQGDFVLHVDSDCLAKDLVHLPDYFVEGRPKLLFRKWEDVGTAICWQAITQHVLKNTPHFEFMPSCGIMYHRSTHELFRRYVEQVHKKDFKKVIQEVAHRSFSEFNALGNFSHLFTPDAYAFVRAIGPGHDSYPRPFRQFYSHAGIAANQVEIDQIMQDVP